MDRKLRDELQEPFSREEVARWWSRVDARLPDPTRPTTLRHLAPAFALGVLVALGLGGASLLQSTPSPKVLPVASVVAGPLSLDGERVPLAEIPRASGQVLARLSDHSELRSEGPAELRVLENSGSYFELKQLRGRVHYEVTPGGPRRWTIDCALATIEVVGTAFWVEAEARKVRVQVEHGVVLVKGEQVPERVQRLVAGDSIEISSEPPPAASSSASIPPVSPAKNAAPSAPPAALPWRELAQKGSFKEAYEQLGSGGIADASSHASTDELFSLADVARYSGHPRDAVAPLARIAQRGGPQGALAAFTLGRVRMDQLGETAAAAQDFERAMALGLAGGLREDAAVRRIEALGKSGQRAQAAELARALIASNPSLKGRLTPWLPTE